MDLGAFVRGARTFVLSADGQAVDVVNGRVICQPTRWLPPFDGERRRGNCSGGQMVNISHMAVTQERRWQGGDQVCAVDHAVNDPLPGLCDKERIADPGVISVSVQELPPSIGC